MQSVWELHLATTVLQGGGYGYPPDLGEAAVKTVLQQTELLCADWV